MPSSYLASSALALSVVLSCAQSAQATGAVELTKDNFEQHTAGKNALVKFLAPW